MSVRFILISLSLAAKYRVSQFCFKEGLLSLQLLSTSIIFSRVEVRRAATHKGDFVVMSPFATPANLYPCLFSMRVCCQTRCPIDSI